LRYTGDRPFESIAEARAFLDSYDVYERYGYGRWAVVRRFDENCLGWCGLKYSPESGETDIGFRFFRKYWGQGYATEAAQACLDYGLQKLGLEQIVGRAMQSNRASVRVLEKIGMRYWKYFDFNNQAGVYYRTLREHISHDER